jgi:hypothetical protein
MNCSASVSFETSFDSKQPKLEPKLVSALSETKRFGCFASIAKQRVSVFRLNRNLMKQNRNKLKTGVLPLDIYILQQTVLTVPQQPVLPLNSSKSPAAYAACPWTRTGTAACGRACPTAAYAASGRVCPTAAFAASGLTRPCSKANFAACLCLYSRLRPLDSSVLQQHVLPLDVCLFFDRLCCLWTRLFHKSLYRLRTCVSSMAACAALERVSSLCFPWTCPCISSTAVCNVLGGVWPAAACLYFKCAYLFNSSQCCAKRSMAYSNLCSICTVCLQEPVLHLSWTCLFTRAFVLHLRVCLQELCASHGRVWLQEFCAAPGCVCLQELCAAPGRACLQEFLLHACLSTRAL